MNTATRLREPIADHIRWMLLAAIPVEYFLLFGLGVEAFGFVAFGWAIFALVRFEETGNQTDRLLSMWLGLATVGLLLASSLRSSETESLTRACFAVVMVSIGLVPVHLLYPEGFDRLDVVAGAGVAFTVGWLGWMQAGATLAIALVLTGVVAAYLIVDARRADVADPSSLVPPISFVGILAGTAFVTIALSA